MYALLYKVTGYSSQSFTCQSAGATISNARKKATSVLKQGRTSQVFICEAVEYLGQKPAPIKITKLKACTKVCKKKVTK